jgi:hypothetical protein
LLDYRHSLWGVRCPWCIKCTCRYWCPDAIGFRLGIAVRSNRCEQPFSISTLRLCTTTLLRAKKKVSDDCSIHGQGYSRKRMSLCQSMMQARISGQLPGYSSTIG